MKVVILAGGLGMRLRPFTQVIPKPLLPVGESSVLEIQLLSLKRHGVTDVFIATSHLSELVAAYIGAAVKAKVTLIEKHKMGGDCLNTGCVPSKALIKSARVLTQMRRAGEYGLRAPAVEFDFAEVMERVQRVVRAVEPHDSVERYTQLGVECIRGEARITSPA